MGIAVSSRFRFEGFVVTVEVVPPAGPDADPLLAALESVSSLPFHSFSVATNPVAKPRMSALAACCMIQNRTSKPATLHCTTRDHNRLSLQGLLWAAKALGIQSVLAATGDYVALEVEARTTTVHDVDVCGLVHMAREAELYTGVVLDARPGSDGLRHQVERLRQKAQAGAQFIVTQPVYDENSAKTLHQATRDLKLPVILGILPLRSVRHARFLHHRVAGIEVPSDVQERMAHARNPIAEGIAGAKEMLDVAARWFAGACIMPPFDHYDILREILD